ncbi:MAG: tRNA lysidine(34) synthetase TilS [Actinobacteria bacterium]|nr:tRNA lysidine(34) synthetase TilS [Actinomycetota bacterium]
MPPAALLTRCTFPPAGTAVSCAVSGGADSTAMLALAVAANCHATAIHVDHGLRDDSAAEAAIVEATALRLGAAFRSVRVEVGRGPNQEARARAARYGALPTDVMTGHTADDQAETLIVNLLRGAASAGLGAMRPGPRRPILALRRHETAALCAELGLTVVHDPSNDDPRHLRNRVRHELLPLIADMSRRDPVPVLVRQADIARADADFLDDLAKEVDPTDAHSLMAAPKALARRAVRRWLSADHPPDAATVERVLAVAGGEAVATDIGGGKSVRRSRQKLSVVMSTTPDVGPTNTPNR